MNVLFLPYMIILATRIFQTLFAMTLSYKNAKREREKVEHTQ